MDDGIISEPVQSVLKECSYLVIQSHELIIKTGSQIGSGGSGEVLSAKLRRSDQAEVDVAVKCVWAIGTLGDRQRFLMRFARELRVWAAVRHTNILPLVGFCLGDNYEIAQLVSPCMVNGNVAQYISRTTPGWVKRLNLIQDIAAGLAFLHGHQPQICHGDLKPANVLVSESHDALLCDFGLASFVETSGTSSGLTTSRLIKGSVRYMSPELLLEADGKHTLASDVWAWACTIFEILTDCPPYVEAKKESNIIIALHRGEPPGNVGLMFEEKEDLATSLSFADRHTLRSWVSKCWSFPPGKRPKMSDIIGGVFEQESIWSPFRRGDILGRVHARIKASINLKDGSTKIAGPWFCVKLNGVCQGTGCCDTEQGMIQHVSVDKEVDFEVHDVREVVALVVRYSVDGIEKRTVSTVVLGVGELARRVSASQQHRYNIQDLDGQISVGYNISFSSLPKVMGFGEQLAGPNPIIVEPPPIYMRDSLSWGTEASRAAFSYLSAGYQPSVPGGRDSLSSGSQTFYTASSNLSSDYQPSVPGGWDQFS